MGRLILNIFGIILFAVAINTLKLSMNWITDREAQEKFLDVLESLSDVVKETRGTNNA